MLWDSSPENSNSGDIYVHSQEVHSDLNTTRLSTKNHVKSPKNNSFNINTSVLTALNTKSFQHDTIPEQMRTSERKNDFVFTQTQQSQKELRASTFNMETPSKSKKSKKRKLDTELEDVQVKKKKKKLKTPQNASKIEKSPTKKKKKSKEKWEMEDNGDKALKKKKKKKSKDKADKKVFRETVSSCDMPHDPLTNQLFSQFRENQINVDGANSFDNVSYSESAKSTFSIDTVKLSQMKSYLDVMEPQKQKCPKSLSSLDIHNIVRASVSEVFSDDTVTANTTTLTKSGLIKNSVVPVKSTVNTNLKKNKSATSYNEGKGFNETESIENNVPKPTIQNNGDNNDEEKKKKKKKKQSKLKDSALDDNNAEKLSKLESQKQVELTANHKKISKKHKKKKSKESNGLSHMHTSPKKQVLSVSELDTTSDSDEANNTCSKENHTAREKTSKPEKVKKKKTPEKSKKEKSVSPFKTSSAPEILSSVKKVESNVASPPKTIKTEPADHHDIADVDSYVASMMSTLLETDIQIDEDDLDLIGPCKSPVKSIRKKKTPKTSKENQIRVETSFEHQDLYREISEEDRDLLRYLSVEIDFDVPDLHKIERGIMRFPLKNQVDEIDALGVDVKKGSYTPDESETIINNWKKFCLIHNLPEKPELFMNLHLRGPDMKLILPKEEGINFARFLARGLPNRLLYSVHRRFRNIYATLKRGKFTPEEDEIIVETVEKTKDSQNVFVRLGKELNRDALCIEKHYIYLRENNKHDYRTERIPHEEGGVIVQKLMEEMEVDDVSMLKDLHIPMGVYAKIGDALQWRQQKVHVYWMTNIHPKLFVTGERELWRVKMKAIDMILDNPEFKTIYHVNWQYFLTDKYFDGWTTYALSKMIRNMFQTQVDPDKTTKLFKETLAEFRVDLAAREGGYLKSAKYDNGVLYVE